MFEKQDGYKGELERVVDYRAVFGSPQGKRVLWDLIKAHNVLGSCFKENPYESAHCEGERNVLLRIIAIMEREPEFIREQMKQGDIE